MENMIDEFSERKADIKKILETAKLTNNEKKTILTAIEFGYATAFCERTFDMNESYFQAQKYRNIYEQIREKLK